MSAGSSLGLPRSRDRCIAQASAIMASGGGSFVALSRLLRPGLCFIFSTFDARGEQGDDASLKRRRRHKGRQIRSSIKAFFILKLLRFSARCYGLLRARRLLDLALSVLNSCQLVAVTQPLVTQPGCERKSGMWSYVVVYSLRLEIRLLRIIV